MNETFRLGGVGMARNDSGELVVQDAYDTRVQLRIYESDVPDLIRFLVENFFEVIGMNISPGVLDDAINERFGENQRTRPDRAGMERAV